MVHTADHPADTDAVKDRPATELYRLAKTLEPMTFDGKILADGQTVELDEAGAHAIVRAILAAMREPSDGMIEAMLDRRENDWPDGIRLGDYISDTEAGLAFTAAIDHILGEP